MLLIGQQQGDCEVYGLHCFGLARVGTKLLRGGELNEHTRVGRVTVAFAQSDRVLCRQQQTTFCAFQELLPILV